jgi:HSP20 family protein
MAIDRWRPRWIEREMDDLFGRLFRDRLMPWTAGERPWAPAVDVLDRTDEFVLRADLPGLEQKNIEVTVQGGTLTIRGTRSETTEVEDGEYYQSERWTGAFARTLNLPPGVDLARVSATFKNGVLEVHVPKAPEARGKTIEVKVA